MTSTYSPLLDAPPDTDDETGIQLEELVPSTSKSPQSPRHRSHRRSTSTRSKPSDDEDDEDEDDHEVHGLMGNGKRRAEGDTDDGKEGDLEAPVFRSEESDIDSAYAMVRRVSLCSQSSSRDVRRGRAS